MKSYPGEKQVVDEILNAFRSAMKYRDIAGELNTIFSITNKLINNLTGDYRTAAKEMYRQLNSIEPILAHTFPDYKSSVFLGPAISKSVLITGESDPKKIKDALKNINEHVWFTLNRLYPDDCPTMYF
jgi:hypothetical protein